jgi:hypothetical protein
MLSSLLSVVFGIRVWGGLLARERAADVVQAARDGAVDDLVADPHLDAAEDRGVDVDLQLDLRP